MHTTRSREVIFIFILSTGLLNHVIIIPALLEVAGRDAWLSVLCTTIPYILYLFLISYISKNLEQKNIYLWLKVNYGKFLYILFMIPLTLLLFANSFVTLLDTSIWVNTYFLPEIPYLFLLLIIIIPCFWISTRTFKQFTLMATIILPIVMILGFFIMSVNIKHKSIQYLFPLFLNGYKPLLNGMIYSFSGLIEIFFILLIQQHLKSKFNFKEILVLGLILVGLTFGPLTGSIMEFGPVTAMNLAYPAYEQWKLMELGDYISRFDFFAMFQWMSGAIFRISLFMYIIANPIKEKLRFKYTAFIYLILFSLALIPISSYTLHKYLNNFLLPVSLIIIFLLSIILFVLIRIRNRKGN